MKHSEIGSRPTLSGKDRMTQALLAHVRPTHFITLSLCQARQIQGEHHGYTWLQGDDTIYSNVHLSFMRSLSKRLTPRVAWDRYQPMLPSTCAVEGGKHGVRNHLHLSIAKPYDVSEEDFRMAICCTAAGNPWIMNGEYAVDIKTVGDSTEAANATYYSIKHGLERILVS
ncbi:hypothetical protein IP81_06520 [Novosphingobium sp. AAP83]|uniref:hypothetical protein n=1 Tax=Novosphingobium sp. AAP83 TaxID=1523425 RepID=UPI0006CCDE35|nr:hypothetical protein [Novosphingobium sp. AAP83]KPF92519.1 hypothetical protein IP81_06520 [Novosphingobium sp. AAP83]